MPQFDQSILLPELVWLFFIFFNFYLFLVIFNKKNILKSFNYNKMILKYLILFTVNISNYIEYISKQYSIRLEKQVKLKLNYLNIVSNLNNLYNTFKVLQLEVPINFFLKNFSIRKGLLKKVKFIN